MRSSGSIKVLLRRIFQALRRRVLIVTSAVEYTGRALALPVLIWAADRLPHAWAYRIGRSLGLLISLFPPYGRSLLYKARAARYGISPGTASLEKFYITRPFAEFIAGRRHLQGKELLYPADIRERNAEIVEDLRKDGTSFIVATGHFSRPAMLVLFSAEAVPDRVVSLVAKLPKKSLNPIKLWHRHNYGQMLRALRKIRPDADFVTAGKISTLKRVLTRLRKPGNVLIVSVDAAWKNTGRTLERPFCGCKVRSFPTGAAFIARRCQCPIVVCVPFVDEEGRIVFDWRRKFDPPDPADAEADLKITDLMLNEIEQAVFERPEQYVIDVLR